MVVLAASICTKAGKPLVSRQFRELSRARIESLLTSFPTLIPPNSQHTSVETADVRYVYQPLDDVYVLLVTNKASNILQDLDTLHLIARVVSDTCRVPEEREILSHAFTLLAAFDEVISLGYRENINLMQVRNVLEMDSHEEKIQEIIARNKEAEAKEELKRRAKQLEIQRREQQRGGGSSASYLGNAYAGRSGTYSPVPRAASPSPFASNTGTSASSAVPKAPAFKGTGMKLGAKKVKGAELLDAMEADPLVAAEPEPEDEPAAAPVQQQQVSATPSAPPPGVIPTGRGSLPSVDKQPVHIAIHETLSLSLTREGAPRALELRGDMNLLIAAADVAKIKLSLKPSASATRLQFKQHPNVAKFAPGGDRVLALKDKSRAFPVGQPLGVLKWRWAEKDEGVVPLSINCWPTPNNDGTSSVSLEYELENPALSLSDVTISIPLPTGSYPTVSTDDAQWTVNVHTHALDWKVGTVDEENATGSLEFTVAGDDVGAFFPVHVGWVSAQSLFGIEVASVHLVEDESAIEFSQEVTLAPELYVVS
ncbi:hypothetical protein EXIGLDRAFT_733942 [Exidia glandulosa HHB12029]|uniref:Coatomer subunit delta n=1 Tax=Exidia glandulosa HHB12029 TaxID=1314781 RepID=A0A166AXW5_EXIGL|nr:hypothetical protein EXIGLDRAFT_733942 [Exidia glandulosa HHB12029]